MATYTTSTGQRIALTRRITGGGEGEIWAVGGQPGKVAKVYHATKRSKGNRESKLRVMVSNPPKDEMRAKWNHISIAWPEDVLYEQNSFAGYLMPKIGQPQTILEFYNPTLRRQNHSSFDWRHLHRTAGNLAKALNALHSKGYVVGDFNEGNIFVNDSALITLVDTDSFQVRDPVSGHIHHCLVGKPEFTPPELQGADFSKVSRNPHHDAFGLAVMIFLLLMEGQHPFTGYPVRPSVSITAPAFEDNIVRGIFPYDVSSGYEPPKTAPKLEVLDTRLQQLFRRSFVVGHSSPISRPTPLDWSDALDSAEHTLVKCMVNHAHYYSNHLSQCPWCERERRLIQKPIVPRKTNPVTTPRSPAPQLAASGRAGTFNRRYFALPVVIALIALAFVIFPPGGNGDQSEGTVPSIVVVDAANNGLTNERQGLGTNTQDRDSDGDSLDDGEEISTYNTDPQMADTDGDGMKDGAEVALGRDPLVDDLSSDSESSGNDSDNDDITDEEEEELGTDPHDSDSDGDGLEDGEEVNTHGTDPTERDSDGDSLVDGPEISTYKTDPNDVDTDGDGLDDNEELQIYYTKPNDRDSDDDSLDDGEEISTYNTDPQMADTDGDGMKDGAEVALGRDPRVDDAPPPQPSTGETVFCPDAFPTRLSVGDTARIVNYQLNVRSGPGTRYSIERRLDPGRTVEILDGPICDDGQLWYYIISEEIRPRDGSPPYQAEGWLVEESGNQWFLEPVR